METNPMRTIAGVMATDQRVTLAGEYLAGPAAR